MVVERAISAHYGVDFEVAGNEYLDKIVQHPFHIPPADPTKLREHFEQMLGSMGFDEACSHVFPLAANNNPRAYLRLVSVWNLVAHLAPHVAPKVWTGSHKKVLAIAVALQVCFPALYRVSKANPGGLIGFTEACINPPRQEIGGYLSERRAQEYASFWRDASVRRFFSGLKGPLGDGVADILGSEATLKQALNLSDLVA